MASVPGSAATTAWDVFLGSVRAEYVESVEKTVDSMRTMPSYEGIDRSALEQVVRGNYDAILDGIAQRRRPDARDDGGVFGGAGATRARQGVSVTEMLTAWRLGLEHLYGTASRVAPEGPEREALLLEF